MITLRLWLLGYLAAGVLPVAAADNATDSAANSAARFLAKSSAAYQTNLVKQKYWNWTISETRALTDKAGKIVRLFPSVTSESIIRSDGRRCNAVIAWGDGREPYLKDAGPDERCQAYNALGTPFEVALLLKTANAKLARQTASSIVISVLPDKALLKSADFALRCAASIKATIELDGESLFPVRIDGEVAESGCDGHFIPVVHSAPVARQPMTTQFRKGATFRVEYTLQKDKFDNPANSFWISTAQHYSQPWSREARLLYYWGREFRVSQEDGHRLVKDITTTAQEFGAGSQLRFDK